MKNLKRIMELKQMLDDSRRFNSGRIKPNEIASRLKFEKQLNEEIKKLTI